MTARIYLAACLVFVFLSVGCLDGGESTAELRVQNVSVQPGSETVIEIQARHAGAMQVGVSPRRNDSYPNVEVGNASLDPEPTSVLESYPPIWLWEPPAGQVNLSVPVRASPDAVPADYWYEITVWNSSGRDGDAVSKPVVVTVEETG